MAASTSPDPGRIFISYRREDSAFPAGWLYDRLCARFGSDYVFKDVDSIDPGDDFLRVIEDAVGSCQVLLALIGDRWLDIADGTGHRRLDEPNDFVRLEIEAALRRDVRVIPILVGRAPLPSGEQLPDSLRGLIRRQAIELNPNRFELDVARLVRTIEKTLAALLEGPPDAQAKIRDVELADRYRQALNHLDQENWQQAANLLAAIEQQHPGFRDAASLFLKAQRGRDLAAWYRQAAVAAQHKDWDTAVAALENICAVAPTYKGAGAQLAQARSAQRLRTLVDEVTTLHQAGRWKDVLVAARELAQLDPDHPDPGGMVSDARAKLREAELAGRYAQGVDHVNRQRWQHAVEVFGKIDQEQPGFRDTKVLLTKAQRQCDLAAWSDQAATAAAHDEWDTAVSALEKICAIDPAYREAGARLEQAKLLRTLVREKPTLVMAAALIAAAAITGAIPPIVMLNTNYEFSPKIWFFQTVSRILIVVAFCVLAGNASSAANKFVMSSAYLMVPIVLLHVINDILIIGDFPLGEQTIAVLDRNVGPILLASAALVALLFGIAVITTERAAWAFILMVWGLCGLVEASLTYKAKMRLIPPEDADHLLLAQNFILLAVAVLLMSRAFVRPGKYLASERV